MQPRAGEKTDTGVGIFCGLALTFPSVPRAQLLAIIAIRAPTANRVKGVLSAAAASQVEGGMVVCCLNAQEQYRVEAAARRMRGPHAAGAFDVASFALVTFAVIVKLAVNAAARKPRRRKWRRRRRWRR